MFIIHDIYHKREGARDKFHAKKKNNNKKQNKAKNIHCFLEAKQNELTKKYMCMFVFV